MHISPQHPLLSSLVNTLRDITLSPFVFRHTIHEITKLLAYEGLGEMDLMLKRIETWRGTNEFEFIDESSIMVVSVLRAALPMHEALIEMLQGSVSGFLGMKRDEYTHESVLYYDRVGDCKGKTVILVDPMVATGGSLCDAIKVIKEKGAEKIIALNIIASPEGIATVEAVHPDVMILNPQLNI
jgi:uracil phosphoribosyltransferase